MSVCLSACLPASLHVLLSEYLRASLSVCVIFMYILCKSTYLYTCLRLFSFFLKHVTLYNRGITIGHAKDQNTRKVRNERLFWIEYHKTMCKHSKNFHVLRANKHKQHISNANENNEYLFFFVEGMSPTAILRLFYVHTKKSIIFFIFILYVLFMCLFARRSGNSSKICIVM